MQVYDIVICTLPVLFFVYGDRGVLMGLSPVQGVLPNCVQNKILELKKWGVLGMLGCSAVKKE
jgi:hypothetical protein